MVAMDLKLHTFVNPKGPLPAIAGTKSGSLLIMGGAASVWADLERYDSRHNGDRMGVNEICMFYSGQLNHGVTLHTDLMPMYAFNQLCLGAKAAWLPMPTHSHQPGPRVQHVWPLTREGATSGLFGILIGLLMGYENIILAGMPCDDSPHFYDPPWRKEEFFNIEGVRDEFKRARDEVFNGRVKSLSGLTREWVGEP